MTLFGNGYYGKPLGVPKPKGTQFDTPLILDLIEGCYLVQTGKLKVSCVDGKQISFRDIKAICRKEYVDFDTKYLVFQSLRDKGYVVSPGIKFGCILQYMSMGQELTTLHTWFKSLNRQIT